MELYGFVLATLLVYNNSLVLLGPTAWGSGIGARKAFAIAVAAQLLGAATSTMPKLAVGTAEFIYIASLYAVLSLAKISVPISILSYSIHFPKLEAAALWLLSPLLAVATYIFCKAVRIGGAAAAPSLFAVMYVFGYNNVSLLVHSPLAAAAAVALGTYLGLGYSRWVMELAALRPRTTAAVNVTVAMAALLGILFSIPISFTLVAYSSMLAASYSQKMRVIKIEKFLKAYIGVLAALGASAIFPYLKPLLAPRA